MKILITGSSGLLGGRLAEYLQLSGEYNLILGSRRAVGNRVQTNWGEPQALIPLCHQVDCIVHLAGMNAADCSTSSRVQLEQDVENTKNLLNAAVSQGVKRFVYVSTAHVYGAMKGHVDELSGTPNNHPYALNHLAKEALVRSAHREGLIEGVVVRLSNSFGAPVDIKANCWMLLINDLCKQGVTEKKFRLHSSGMQQRDFVPITQVCSALCHLIRLPSSRLDDGLFNIGGQCSLTVKEMAQLVASRFFYVTGFKPKIEIPEVATEEVAESLDFSIGKLLNSGYILDSSDIINMEIDKLITFCQANGSRMT